MNDAERLIDVARSFKAKPGALIVNIPAHAWNETAQARVSLALRFVRLPLVLQFRAMMEDWPLDAIIRAVNV